jgi:GT2 family glycosyltransferase
MPIRNEARFLERSLSAILAQDYSPGRIEVLIVDGMSEDGTREVVQRFITSNARPSIRIIDNPQRVVPTGLNIAIRQAKGDVIVRVDGHTQIAPDYVSTGVAMLMRTTADNVGGLMTPVGHGYIGETIALAHNLRFGLGGGLFHRAPKETEADTVYMGIFRRDVFDRVGLFDEELVRNQDIEFNGRIRRAGGRIVLSPRIRSTYECRNSLRGLWKQNYANGLWLFPTLAKTPLALSLRHHVPLVFVSALICSAIASLTLPAGWMALGAVTGSYILACSIASVAAAVRHGWRFAASLPLVFSVLHVSYGTGSLVGCAQTIARSFKRRLFSRPV